MENDTNSGTIGWENKPTPDNIVRRKLDNRNVDYTKLIAPVGQQVSLQGDSQFGIHGATIGIMPNIQQFLGNTGTYFNKGQSEDNFSAVDINTFSCNCGRKDSFKVLPSDTKNKGKIIKCFSCEAIYGIIPKNIFDIISSPTAGAMTQEEIDRVVQRQPKTNMYIVFQKQKT